MKIIVAQTQNDIQAIRELFEDYAASLSFNLCFQNFDQELRGLPGDYGPPFGCLLLAILDDHPAGCVALRQIEPRIAEMKRLFVRPSHRGTGLGRQLVQAVVEEARNRGFERIRLDTTPAMTEAIQLYGKLGFRKIEPYRHNPIEGAIYLELLLN